MAKHQRDSKKETIITAAEEEFKQKGYDGARMMEIANRAGVGHPLLHYHFNNKKKLFQHVIRRKFNILSQSMLVFLDETDIDILEIIKSMVVRHFDIVQQHGDYIRMVVNEFEKNPELIDEIKPAVVEQLMQTSDKLQKKLDEAASAGKICPIKASDLLLDIVSLNLSCIWTTPLLRSATGRTNDCDLIGSRKSENIKMILGRLRPYNNPDIE